VPARARVIVDSLLHPARRRAAHRRLKDTNPRSILFICHGNICRSPFAAAVFASALPATLARTVTIASAGFIGPGRSPPIHAQNTARALGVDISNHRSATISPESLNAADLVVVMSSAQQRGIASQVAAGAKVLVLGDLDPLPITQRTIPDPWDGPVDAFEESYGRITRCVRELVRIAWAVP
jgi:protein-tyrosine phosphatase